MGYHYHHALQRLQPTGSAMAAKPRNTEQKRAVCRAFEEADGPLSAQLVWERAKAFAPSLGIATVYRCIKELIAQDEVQLVESPIGPMYERSPRHHHHFFCSSCQRAFCIEGCVPGWKSLAPQGFKVLSHELSLSGLCADCAQATTPEKNAP